MSLPLDLYSTDEQPAPGAWVPLDGNIAPPQLAPAADPNPRVMKERVGESTIPLSSPSRHCRLTFSGCFSTVHVI